MRNALYPSRQARYVVGEELKTLVKAGTKVERDPFYMTQQQETPSSTPKRPEMDESEWENLVLPSMPVCCIWSKNIGIS
jgi:hypothetical protein